MTEVSDERPTIWTGHVIVQARDPAASAAFYEAIGMRPVFSGDGIAVLELRGGTHLVVRPADDEHVGGDADFDLMVEDLATTHATWDAAGLPVSEIRPGSIHEAFTVTDPSGNTITVSSSHVVGPV
jgi:catechol 2,3-dioxygenase-like lactoylglutathione lyase family enzyme